ncbi:MAG: DUF6263 family protein [Ignavibacteria bacterium]
MKNVFMVVLVFILLTGCGKKQNSAEKLSGTAKMDSTGALQTVKDNAPPKDVLLAYCLKKDQHLTYKVTSLSAQNQSLTTDTIVKQFVKQNVSYVVDLDVKEVDNDKVMDIKVTVKSIILHAEANGQKVNYESGKITDPKEKLKYVEYESLLNKPFFVRVNPKGEILEVYRVDKIVDKFLEMRGVKDSVTSEQKKQFQNNMSEGALKPLIQQIFRILPDKSIAVDSAWNYSYGSKLTVFEVKNTNKYKVLGFEKLNDDRLALISASLELSAKGKNKFSEKGVDYDFKTPEAEGSGKIYFNFTKGYVQSSKTSSRIRLSTSMTMAKSPKGPMKAVRSDVVENTNIIELL